MVESLEKKVGKEEENFPKKRLLKGGKVSIHTIKIL